MNTMRFRKITAGDPNQLCALQLRDFKTGEEQRNTPLIRYLTLEKFLSLLELEAVWFSRLGALQDRFEGTLPRRAREISLERDREIAGKIPEPLRPAALKMTDQAIEACRNLTVVNCWFLGKEESAKMWQDYGQGGNGVAIRSTVKRLSSCFMVTGDFAGIAEIGRVQYVDFDLHEIAAEDSGNVNAKAFLKEKSYAWEQEVRIMTFNQVHTGCLNPDGSPVTISQVEPSGFAGVISRKGFYVKCRLSEMIQSVIVSPQTQPHFFTLIQRLIERYRLSVPVEKSRLLSATQKVSP